MKKCAACEKNLDKVHFTKNRSKEDGLSAYCRSCQRDKRIRLGLQKPIGWKRKTENIVEYRKEWTKKNPGYNTRAKKNWLKKNRERDLVRQKVKYAMKTGKLVKRPCVKCGNIEVDAHHEDYSKPLDVIWLCKFHHRELHKERKSLGKI